MITNLQFMTLENLSNMVNPKRNIYKIPWETEIDKISGQNWEHGVGGGEGGGEENGSEEENL